MDTLVVATAAVAAAAATDAAYLNYGEASSYLSIDSDNYIDVASFLLSTHWRRDDDGWCLCFSAAAVGVRSNCCDSLLSVKSCWQLSSGMGSCR